jgi:hypothetical protein
MDIFIPVMLLMFHTIIIYFLMGYRRYLAVTKKGASADYYKLYVGEETEDCRVVARHVINLLEAPVLFYLGAMIAFVTGLAGTGILTLAWVYVLLRLLHSAIHLSANVVIWRFRVFVLSMMVLTAFLFTIAYRLFLPG